MLPKYPSLYLAVIMKIWLFLYLAVSAAIAVPLGTQSQDTRYIQYIDENGDMQTIDLEDQLDIDLLNKNADNNRYLLYTRRNRLASQTLNPDNPTGIILSNFNVDNPTVVVVHGWLGHQHTNLNPTLIDAFLGKDDFNVIVLEWRNLANSNYITAANGVPAVGRGLGQFLRALHTITGAPYEKMHLIGFSLGAHLVGNAGRELDGRVARITGLDPAGPLWRLNDDRLRSTDAIYVEAIHTDGAMTGLGIGTTVADADFFPNGGSSQPGCITNICDHNRSWELFAASVSFDHLVGFQCSSTLQITMNSCKGDHMRMGNSDLHKTGSGMYRLSTQRSYPY